MAAHPADIVEFWRQAGAGRWFEKDTAFDAAIRLKFEPTHHAAARGEYDSWIETPQGALALVILLDQFPRNLYRGSGHQFATGPAAFDRITCAARDGPFASRVTRMSCGRTNATAATAARAASFARPARSCSTQAWECGWLPGAAAK